MTETKFNINTNEYLPLRDVVFNTLRDAILTGKLVPGERLMENQLAEKLGVSRTPVREALRMLELESGRVRAQKGRAGAGYDRKGYRKYSGNQKRAGRACNLSGL